MKDTRISDFCMAVFIFILGILTVRYAAVMPTAATGLGAGGFPRVIGYCLICLGVVQIIMVGRKGFKDCHIHVDGRSLKPMIMTAILAFLYVGLLRQAGFLILTPILLFCVMTVFGFRKYVAAVIISVVTSVVIYVVFSKIFMIFLPECKWF